MVRDFNEICTAIYSGENPELVAQMFIEFSFQRQLYTDFNRFILAGKHEYAKVISWNKSRLRDSLAKCPVSLKSGENGTESHYHPIYYALDEIMSFPILYLRDEGLATLFQTTLFSLQRIANRKVLPVCQDNE